MAKSYMELKKMGFVRQKQEEFCSCRCKSSAGEFTVEQLETITAVAKNFGKNFVHVTSRQGIDIPFIPIESVDEVKKILAAGGVDVVTGMTITACKGTAICNFAWIDTTRLAKSFAQKFDGRELPHKFKIGFSGCPNDCMKVASNDIGVKGGVIPHYVAENCKYCGACQAACPVKIISVDRKEKNFTLERENCINCGRCIRACRFDALRPEVCYKIYFGGKVYLPRLTGEEKVFDAVDRALNFYATHGKKLERLGKTIRRIGEENFVSEIAN